MKKGIYIPLSCAILGVAALSGCSTTNKIPDATIENAIQDSTNIYSDYGLSIQQLSFDSRNYDKQEKTEAVTVTVNADNADTAYTATYDVLGKLSDKSWRIVSVTQTSEEVKPKAALTYEDVSLFSGELLQAAQGTSRFRMPVQCTFRAVRLIATLPLLPLLQVWFLKQIHNTSTLSATALLLSTTRLTAGFFQIIPSVIMV